jgi:hypothetical protein
MFPEITLWGPRVFFKNIEKVVFHWENTSVKKQSLAIQTKVFVFASENIRDKS